MGIATAGAVVWALGCGESVGAGVGEGTDGTTEASDASTGRSATGDGSEGEQTASGTTVGDSDDPDDTGEIDGSDGSDGTETGPEPITLDRVGIFSTGVNYFELDAEGEPLRFHYGNGNSRWAASATALAGDWDGDGEDTVALFDNAARSYVLASENDSDEAEGAPARIGLRGVPEPPGVGGEMVSEIVVAGDWDGDGVDGLALYHPGSQTVYLVDDPTTGAMTSSVVLSTEAGWPAAGLPVAGDWDGDGDDELGLLADGSAYLADDAAAEAPTLTFAVTGARAVAGDWDGDGVDTLGIFDGATNEFSLLHHNGAGAMAETVQLGHVEPGYWVWAPLAGRWRVPDAPVARDGFDFVEADPAAHGIDGAALEQALDDGASVYQVLSVVVLRHGELVGERYFHGFSRHIAGNIKSVSKSVLSALYGIALDEGTIASLDTPVASLLPGYFAGLGAEKQAITVGDIMTMRGGLQWSEVPTYVGGMIVAPNFVEYVLGQPLVSLPGSTYVYSTGLTHVGSAALTEATGESTADFARTRLLQPLGITVPRWDGSPEGYPTGGAEMWMRPRDMARFGELYLAGGTLDGESILTPAWVEQSGDPWIPEAGGRTYGLWWRERPWSSYPYDDSFFAWGHGGQFIFLFPSWDLQVVVTSKWNVDGTASGESAAAIFAWVDGEILTTVGD